MKKEEEEKKEKESDLYRLHLLRDKKSKSIAGDIPGDRTVFSITNDVLNDEGKDPVSVKLVKYTSHPHFSYFRGEDDELAKYTLAEETILALRNLAHGRQNDEEEEKVESEVSSELPYVRDSFALDYDPDHYDPENFFSSHVGSSSNLNRQALSQVSGTFSKTSGMRRNK